VVLGNVVLGRLNVEGAPVALVLCISHVHALLVVGNHGGRGTVFRPKKSLATEEVVESNDQLLLLLLQ